VYQKLYEESWKQENIVFKFDTMFFYRIFEFLPKKIYVIPHNII
jgi:hypothetical protein